MLVSNVVHEWFQHKLNYFLFCQKFEKNIYYLCQNFNNYYKNQNLKNSDWSGLNFHKDNKIMFIVLYKHYLPKNSELQKPIVQVKIQRVSPNFGAYTLGAYGP
jgi:hypothetical protein